MILSPTQIDKLKIDQVQIAVRIKQPPFGYELFQTSYDRVTFVFAYLKFSICIPYKIDMKIKISEVIPHCLYKNDVDFKLVCEATVIKSDIVKAKELGNHLSVMILPGLKSFKPDEYIQVITLKCKC